MKKLLLTSIAVLFLATGTAHAETWHFDNYKRCTATTKFELYSWEAKYDEWPKWPMATLDHLPMRGGPSFSVLEPPNSVTVTFEREHLAKLEAAVRFLRKCRPWVWDRDRQKVIGKPIGEAK
jgi:hypothetical protein